MDNIVSRNRQRKSSQPIKPDSTPLPPLLGPTPRSTMKLAKSRRNIPLGVFKLARLHTLESLICVYPAIWGICLSAGTNDIKFTPSSFFKILFSNWISMTVAHMTFCTFNDIVDRNFDKKVERTKSRPLPAGIISVRGAIIAFLIEAGATGYITYHSLGRDATITCMPIWVLSTIYPFMKRFVQWPQIILGPTIGMAVLPGWVSVAGLESVHKAIPMFTATTAWVIYFDTIYATQDTKDDRKAGVKSLAIVLQDNLSIYQFLGFLGCLQVALLSFTAHQANMSAIFWILAVLVWCCNIPVQLGLLDVQKPKTGGKVFGMNILLGFWVSGVAVLELWVVTVLKVDVNGAIAKNTSLLVQTIKTAIESQTIAI